jgi:type II secretory pathway component PulJ
VEALLGAVVGGVLTAIGSLIVALTMDKRTREQQRRENQMAKASEVLSAMQALNRKLIDVALQT